MRDNTRTTLRSIVPCMIIVDGPADGANDRASLLAQEVNTTYRDREAAGEPRTKLYLCEGSPTTELQIDEAFGGDPRTLEGLTMSPSLLVPRVVAVIAARNEYQQARKIWGDSARGDGKPTPPAIAQALAEAGDRLDRALAALGDRP